MGNALRGSKRKTTKIMKIDGETTKHKTPIQAMEITNNHPGHVLLDSEAVKKYGIRAEPLGPAQYLEPRKVYFLVELPKVTDPVAQNRVPRRVRSGGIHMGAKERLESLMLSKRSVSDMSAFKPPEAGGVRVRMRLPRAEVERLMSQSRDRADAARRIMDLCDVMEKSGSSRAGFSGSLHPPLEVVRETSPLGVEEGFKRQQVQILYRPLIHQS
ncbi:hypothetical protein V2J09_015075 [Rumex salicifolius]